MVSNVEKEQQSNKSLNLNEDGYKSRIPRSIANYIHLPFFFLFDELYRQTGGGGGGHNTLL